MALITTMPLVSLLSAIMSIFSIILSILILRKVYEEEYRRPWLFIGISASLFGFSELVRFSMSYLKFYIFGLGYTEVSIYLLVFVSVAFLFYGLLLEFFILKYYKGKFVKFKFIPVQEGSLGGELEINITTGVGYLAYKKDRNFLFEQFTKATKVGFEGFLIGEDNPRDVRRKYSLQKTPIAWVTQMETSLDAAYIKGSIDENSDLVDPLQLNNIIGFVDNFLEQSVKPFIVIEANLLFKVNSHSIVLEFLKYLSSKMKRYDGVLVVMLNSDVLRDGELSELKLFLRDLE